ncbi:MAG: sensor histidine kinase [Caldilineaceae bacterium]
MHISVSQLRADELNRRTNQLWIGIWLATILILVSTFILRRLTGNSTTPFAIAIQIVLNGLVVANLLLFKTRYARLLQGIFVFAIHLAVPPVLLLYGGTRGFGDFAVYMAVLLSILYGWQRWMFATFGIMAATLIGVLYLDTTGQSVAPLLDYSAQFSTIKFVVIGFIMIFALRFINTFYNGLLETYRTFAEEQVRLNHELKASEQALEAMNKNLIASRQTIVTAREAERRRLRRDLHDGLGPTLAAQVFRIGIAQQMVHKDAGKAATLLTDVESGIRDTLANVRELVYGLRPPMLDQLGLLGAMSDFAKQQEGRVAVSLDLPADVSHISAAVEVALFRIYQTALDNVVKHAQATHCDVQLHVEAESVTLTISDDGIGLGDLHTSGVGLTSMQERAEELGGAFSILPAQPRGTKLQVTIPLLEDSTL